MPDFFAGFGWPASVGNEYKGRRSDDYAEKVIER
jgi:hypothetical protein